MFRMTKTNEDIGLFIKMINMIEFKCMRESISIRRAYLLPHSDRIFLKQKLHESKEAKEDEITTG